MKTLLLVASQVLMLLFGSIVWANSCPDSFMERGWEPIQEGEVDMKNCGPEYPIRLGSYFLTCDIKYTSYSGHAVLFEKQSEQPEYYTYEFALCLIGNDENLNVEVLNKQRVILKDK